LLQPKRLRAIESIKGFAMSIAK